MGAVNDDLLDDHGLAIALWGCGLTMMNFSVSDDERRKFVGAFVSY